MNLNDNISSLLEEKRIINIAITGATCSGKTTLAERLKKDFGQKYTVTVIKQDDYFKDIDSNFPRCRYGYLTDTPEAFHTREFRSDVKELLTTFKTVIPRYHIETNRRIAKDKEEKLSDINIFEGLHTIDLLKEGGDFYKIFLNTNLDLCLKRRIQRDTTKYGIPKERVRENFYLCILPMYHQFIMPQLGLADLVINDNNL